MLPWMSRKKRQEAAESQSARLPDGERIYAVGDIHGRSDLLTDLIEQIQQDLRWGEFERSTIVFLGDYIDRGAQSSQVLDILAGNPFGDTDTISLIGNHEAVLLQFLQDAEIGRDWVRFGGDMTLASYGVRLKRDDPGIAELLDAQRKLAEVLPEHHLRYLHSLKLSFRAGDYLFVHAGIRPGVPIHEQDGNDLIWIRNRFLKSDADFGCVVVHGHTPDLEIQNLHNRIGVDTGAYFSGKLTAAVLEGDTRRFLTT